MRRDVQWGEPVGPLTTQARVCTIVGDVLGMLHTSVCYRGKDGQASSQEQGKKHSTWTPACPTNLIPGPIFPTPP